MHICARKNYFQKKLPGFIQTAFGLLGFVFVKFIHQAAQTELLDVPVGDAVVALVVSSREDEPHVLHKVSVKLTQAAVGGENGKVPAAPCQLAALLRGIEFFIEYAYQLCGAFVTAQPLFAFSAVKHCSLAFDLCFHFSHRRL